MLATLVAAHAIASNPGGVEIPSAESLQTTIAAMDSAVFNAFNRCSDPEQLERHASYFAADVEFYHDMGGVTWTRDAMLASTKKHVCGNFGRELIPDTLQVHPIKDFGAISQGTHRFCQFASGKCEGLADFTMIWRHKDGAWQVTRVLSYGHRAAGGGP
ncbi:nuclear transport factor 2 family protein [Pseudomarimonas salicorniae]|uniref:Nuclear transport factor 2 family protein n=1 Tax=Pseudomarimonas salicorniae TaxID=2933270 RepID=A0ABT0GM37_9GAMM|nr:nuclear transport factor 2 family protein [Lysobacter sp. CAU 1642]MCK7595611.1 nuclear transport factor 2 family protein [Lysobacter sp. CAU 1642]